MSNSKGLLHQTGNLHPSENNKPKNSKHNVDVDFKIDERKVEKVIDDAMKRIVNRLNGK